MNSLSKVYFTLTLLAAIGCSGSKGGGHGDEGGTVPPADQKAECVERQKKALSEAGLSLNGGTDEIKKIMGKNPEFYAALPYCSP